MPIRIEYRAAETAAWLTGRAGAATCPGGWGRQKNANSDPRVRRQLWALQPRKAGRPPRVNSCGANS
eukprot:15478480-Alexandrium_andersonii.AAC.1